MVNQSLINLVIILVGGICILVIGFVFQRKAIKKRKAEMDIMNSNYNNSSSNLGGTSLLPEEESMKSYIEQYKSTYSREQIKSALVESGNDSIKVDEMLNRFF